MEEFYLRGKKIILYGVGSSSKPISDVLNEEKIFVSVYVDQRADVIKENEGIPVISMEQVAGFTEEKDEFVVIITIRNVFEHSKLAKKFYDIGYKNIIYKPQSILQGISGSIQESINDSYETLTAKFNIPEKATACYDREIFLFSDEGLRKQLEDYLIAALPVELLFSNTNDKMPIWSRRNFVADYAAVDLYRAFSNRDSLLFSEEIDKYIDWFALPGAKIVGVNTDGNWRELLIDARLKVYNEMEYNLNVNPDFFIINCTTVKYCEKKGFELVASGKNRVSFLIAKGYRYIPVKIKVENYEKFINILQTNAICDYLNVNEEDSVFAPIPHPYFYHYQVDAPDYFMTCIARIAKSISKWIYSEQGCFAYLNYRMSIYINDEGYASRYFRMLGFQVRRYLVRGEKLCGLLDDLYYFDENDFSDTDYESSFSIISTDIPQDCLLQTIRNTQRMCFLVKKKNDEDLIIKRELLRSGFETGEKFMETMWNGQYVEGWKYIRGES